MSEQRPEPFSESFGPNLFILNSEPTPLEEEAMMRHGQWTFWQRWGWRFRYLWARLTGNNRYPAVKCPTCGRIG